jgi:predicted alpha/beta hydrolase family esterase
MKSYIIVHGTKGSPEGNWFQSLAAGLREAGATVVVPRMPTPEGHSLTGWLQAFDEQCTLVDHNTTIIGHSLGATFLLRYLERTSVKIACSVFVAGVLSQIGIPEYDALNSSFIETPYDWTRILQHAGHVECIYGENDPYVPEGQSLEMARLLQVPPTRIEGGLHLNSEGGYNEFPLLLQRLLALRA